MRIGIKCASSAIYKKPPLWRGFQFLTKIALIFSSKAIYARNLLWTTFLSWAALLTADPYDPPILYLTWQRDPTTTMTIQWITDDSVKINEIEYKRETESDWHYFSGVHYPFPDGKKYLLHRVELSELYPNTNYQFRVGHEGVEYKFRTMPSQLDTPIRFVVGGDMYHDSLNILEETNIQAAKFDPHFALAGGDLAYAANRIKIISQKTERWLEWLKAWKETMVTPNGHLVPILATLGNHDVTGRFNESPSESPYYYLFFPMEKTQGYYVLDFGSYLSVFVLDTEHTHPIQGEQTTWLTGVLEDRKSVPHKIALYHIPAYPSYRDFKNKYSMSIRRNWVPLFEQYGLNLAFEHHDHAYKRTHPLCRNKIASDGIIYIGDGAWGVKKARTPKTPKQRFYLAKSAEKRHFIGVTLDSHSRRIQAIDPKGILFDECLQLLKNKPAEPEDKPNETQVVRKSNLCQFVK